ncbi:MAG: hypothetical protein ABEI27_01440, partial [Halobellus sp.]
RVDEYERVMRWRAAHTEGGAYAASRALGLPRGRIRPWFEGAKPHAKRAIETAGRHGWLDTEPGDTTFEGLVVLHAWLLAGGSIAAETFAPSCAIGADDPEDLVRTAFDTVGVPSRVVNGGSRDRTVERRPSGPGGSHLGRFLPGCSTHRWARSSTCRRRRFGGSNPPPERRGCGGHKRTSPSVERRWTPNGTGMRYISANEDTPSIGRPYSSCSGASSITQN